MTTLTAQQIFDKVTAHLLKQNRKAELSDIHNNDNICVYLASNGDKCAIGALLPDGHAAQISGKSVYYICNDFSDIHELLIGNTRDFRRINFLTSLQRLHDEYPPSEWYNLLKFIALDYSLSYAVLESFNPAAV